MGTRLDFLKSPPPSSLDRLLAVALGLLFLLLYGLSSASVWELNTVFTMDGAELVIASRELGIDHPPGHPLYLILGFLISRLPFSSPDLGVIAVSVVCGALTVPLVYLAALEATLRRIPSLLSALVLGLSGIFWLHSTIVEVYALQSLLLALLTWAELRLLRATGLAGLPLVTFAWGLAATANILLSVLLLPGVFLCLVACRLRPLEAPGPRHPWLKAALAGGLGLMPLLYIPWRLTDGSSFINDLVYISGYPLQSLRWYAWYLSGWEFLSSKVTAYGLGDYPRLLGQYLLSQSNHLSPLLPGLALLGGWVGIGQLWRYGRESWIQAVPKRSLGRKAVAPPRTWATLLQALRAHPGQGQALMALLLMGELLLTAGPVVGYQVPDREVFYLPSFLFLCWLAALGLRALQEKVPRGGSLAVGLLCLVAAGVAWKGSSFVLPLTRDTQTFAGRLERYLALPAHAVIIGYDDGHASRYRYFQRIRGLRPDIAVETFSRLAPRFQGELPASSQELTERELRAGLNMADRLSTMERLAKQYAGRPLFLILSDEAPAEFPGFRFRRAPMDPFLLSLEPKAQPVSSELAPEVAVTVKTEAFPGEVRFVGWTLRGLDGQGSTCFPTPLSVGQVPVDGVIVRGELFEFSFATQRTGKPGNQYFAQFTLLDAAGRVLAAQDGEFTASRQQQVLEATTPQGHYRRDSFDFKVPRAAPAGIYTLAARLYQGSDEVVGEYRGKPIRRMITVLPLRQWNGPEEYAPLGTILVQ